jgi:uridine kinase
VLSWGEALAEAVCRLPGGATCFAGIDGFAGSGKSTFAAELAERLAGAVVVHVDDFAGPHVPEWDWPRMQEQLVDPLAAGRTAQYQRWEWNRDEPAEWYDVPAGVPVIIEGVSSTRCELGVPWSLQVWVEAPRAVRLHRAEVRDGAQMLSQWTDVWMPSEDAYAERERPQERVDLVVDGTSMPPAPGWDHG